MSKSQLDKDIKWLEKSLCKLYGERPPLSYIYKLDSGKVVSANGYSMFCLLDDEDNNFVNGFNETTYSKKHGYTFEYLERERYKYPIAVCELYLEKTRFYQTEVTVNAQEFVKALKQVKVFTNFIRIYVSDKNIIVYGRNLEQGDCYVFVPCNGYDKSLHQELYKQEPYNTDNRLWGALDTVEKAVSLLGENVTEWHYDLRYLLDVLSCFGSKYKEKDIVKMQFHSDLDVTISFDNKKAIVMGMKKD